MTLIMDEIYFNFCYLAIKRHLVYHTLLGSQVHLFKMDRMLLTLSSLITHRQINQYSAICLREFQRLELMRQRPLRVWNYQCKHLHWRPPRLQALQIKFPRQSLSRCRISKQTRYSYNIVLATIIILIAFRSLACLNLLAYCMD